jgi:hypothetical protein
MNEKRQSHTSQQYHYGNLATMRRFGRPDLTVLQPVKYKHGRYPWRECDGDLERMARLLLSGIWHVKNINTIISYRILDLSAGSFLYSRGARLVKIKPTFAQQLGIDEQKSEFNSEE